MRPSVRRSRKKVLPDTSRHNTSIRAAETGVTSRPPSGILVCTSRRGSGCGAGSALAGRGAVKKKGRERRHHAKIKQTEQQTGTARAESRGAAPPVTRRRLSEQRADDARAAEGKRSEGFAGGHNQAGGSR